MLVIRGLIFGGLIFEGAYIRDFTVFIQQMKRLEKDAVSIPPSFADQDSSCSPTKPDSSTAGGSFGRLMLKANPKFRMVISAPYERT